MVAITMHGDVGRTTIEWCLPGGACSKPARVIVSARSMHLRLTEAELPVLLEMISLAANVATWNRKPGSEKGIAAFEALESKVLEKARHSGMGDAIEFCEETQDHQLTQAYQDQSFFAGCYDEFRSESFWEELVHRLVDRDLVKQLGKKRVLALTDEERQQKGADLEKRYWEEFGTYGAERLAVIFPPREG